MTYIFWKLVFDVVSNTIFSFNFDEYKINTNFIGEEEQSDDDDYYYHGEDGTSELDAQTVTSADPDEYYDYQVRSTYLPSTWCIVKGRAKASPFITNFYILEKFHIF